MWLLGILSGNSSYPKNLSSSVSKLSLTNSPVKLLDTYPIVIKKALSPLGKSIKQSSPEVVP